MILQMLTKRWVQIALLLLLLAGAVTLRLNEPLAILRLNQVTFDFYNQLFPRQRSHDVVIVDIDETSLQKFGQWPWPRTVVGQLPLKLRQAGAKVVAFDMVFAEHDRTSPRVLARMPEMAPVAAELLKLPDNDAVFADDIAKAGNVVMGFVGSGENNQELPDPKGSLGVRGDMLKRVNRRRFFAVDLPELTAAAAGFGSFTTEPDTQDNGVLRVVPIVIGKSDENFDVKKIYPGLALEAVRIALGQSIFVCSNHPKYCNQSEYVTLGPHEIPTTDGGKMRIYYAGNKKWEGDFIPAWQVLEGQVPPERIKDKIVFIGTSAIGLLDLRSSGLNSAMPGVEAHGEIAEQILHDEFLVRDSAAAGVELVAAGVVSIAVILLAPFISLGTLALVVAVLIAGSVSGCLYAYKHFGLLIDPLYPSLMVGVIFVLSSILTNLRTELEKRQIRQAFGHYISPVLIEELAKNPEKLKLGGEVRELTVMFTDIRNFTSISETMDPAELIRMMNDFLTPMTSAVLDNRGTVDKYMGDAMMTFWNAPLDDALHARNACKASIEMVRALGPVNAELKVRAEKAGRRFIELRAGIGIHSGKASVGNMGSKQRFAYSALGDTVNLASRMEGQTKAYGIAIMISHTTHAQVPEFASIELDLLAVKGRAEAERVYTLLGDDAVAKTQAFKDFAALHERLLAAYRAQKWDEAADLIRQCAELRPDLAALYQLYQTRIAAYRDHPPPADWTGVWVAKEK